MPNSEFKVWIIKWQKKKVNMTQMFCYIMKGCYNVIKQEQINTDFV